MSAESSAAAAVVLPMPISPNPIACTPRRAARSTETTPAESASPSSTSVIADSTVKLREPRRTFAWRMPVSAVRSASTPDVDDLDVDGIRARDDVDRRAAALEVLHHFGGDGARIRAHSFIGDAMIRAKHADARAIDGRRERLLQDGQANGDVLEPAQCTERLRLGVDRALGSDLGQSGRAASCSECSNDDRSGSSPRPRCCR